MPQRETTITLGVIVTLVLIVTATALVNHEDAADTTATIQTKTAVTTPTPTPTPTAPSNTGTASTYKDGTYKEAGSYGSPGGTEAITISITLKDDTITATSATNGATDGEGKEYQDEFISGYSSLVVGKSIDSVSLSRVSGSSLTSKGFNDALAKIKADAKT